MKFSVWQTVREVFEYCWQERRLAVSFSALPLLGMVLLYSAIAAFSALTSPSEGTVATLALVAMCVMMILYLPLTVSWYRIVVLGPQEARQRPLFSLGAREWRLLGWQVAFTLVLGLAAIVCAGISYLMLTPQDALGLQLLGIIWTGFWLISLGLIIMRLSLISALVALDQPVKLKIIWQRTKGMSWRLLRSTLLVALGSVIPAIVIGLVFLIVGMLVGIVAGDETGAIVEFFIVLAQNVGSFISMILLATLFGFVYKMLTEHALQTETPPAEAPQAASISPDQTGNI
jgi:hypothetical protein